MEATIGTESYNDSGCWYRRHELAQQNNNDLMTLHPTKPNDETTDSLVINGAPMHVEYPVTQNIHIILACGLPNTCP